MRESVLEEETKMKKGFKKQLTTIICVSMIISMAFAVTACGKKVSNADATEIAATTNTDANELGEGSVQFTFEVVDAEGTTSSYTIHTDKKTVGEALLELGLIDGDDSEYGLYVKSVNGMVADYDVDQTYWAFYVDGEYASTGVDQTDVVAGSTYAFKVEK